MSCNVNFEAKFLEESRRYLICLLLFCHHFSLSRNKNDMIYKYCGYNHHSFFLKFKEFGMRFSFHSYGDILSFVCATCVYLKNACVLRELECVTSVESSWKIWRKNSLQLDLDPTSFTIHRQYIHRNVGNLVGLLHGCSCSSICAAILSSFTL